MTQCVEVWCGVVCWSLARRCVCACVVGRCMCVCNTEVRGGKYR